MRRPVSRRSIIAFWLIVFSIVGTAPYGVIPCCTSGYPSIAPSSATATSLQVTSIVAMPNAYFSMTLMTGWGE